MAPLQSQTGAKLDMRAWPLGLYDDALIAPAVDQVYRVAVSLEATMADRRALQLL